jgi:hypothetical protein
MDEHRVTGVDMTPEGVLVTFADGYAFLFESEFLFKIRLKEGQLIGKKDSDAK